MSKKAIPGLKNALTNIAKVIKWLNENQHKFEGRHWADAYWGAREVQGDLKIFAMQEKEDK